MKRTYQIKGGDISLCLDQMRESKHAIKTITHEFRSRIMDFIEINEDIIVNDLIELLDSEQPIVSQHLRRLRKYKIVNFHSHGKYRFYHLNNSSIIQILKLCNGNLEKGFSEFRALGNAFRVKILQYIDSKGGVPVHEIYRVLHAEQSETSIALSILKKSGFVSCTKEGRFRHYFVNYAKVKEVCDRVTLYNEYLRSHNDSNLIPSTLQK